MNELSLPAVRLVRWNSLADSQYW